MVNKPEFEKLVRHDGKISFSWGGRRLAETRFKSPKGRIIKILGETGPFSQPFKNAILSDHDQILERRHLEIELSGAKKVLNALTDAPPGSDYSALLERLHADPIQRKGDCILCPVWRHVHAMDLTAAAVLRYLFPEKSGEIYLLTVVFGFAADLFELEDRVHEAQHSIQTIVTAMNKRRRGLVMVGSLEPDLRSHAELTAPNSDLPKLMAELGRTAPDAGGWVLSGHFMVRVPHKEDLRELFQDEYPSRGWTRVQFDAVHQNNTLAENMMYVLGYMAKYPKPLFSIPTRGAKRKDAEKIFSGIATAFLGPSYLELDVEHNFNVDEAIRQWALFMDRMGPKNMLYSVENVHAQKWYSQSEWNYIRQTDQDMMSDSTHLIELLRDRELIGGRKMADKGDKKIIRKMRRLRTRKLKFDREWFEATNLEDVDPFTQPVDLDAWLYSKKKPR